MSRAIPANFNEYLLDQTSRNTGIVCDGGIMPLRNNPDPTSLWFKNCIRGEDVMFLKEAVAARRNDELNGGLDDTSIKASRLNLLQTQLGWLYSSNMWTDTDPISAIGFHNMGESMPYWNDVQSYVFSCMNQIAQSSAGDVYANLERIPMENLFRDIKKLSYTILNGGSTYYQYNGYELSNVLTYRHYAEQRYSSGSPPRIVDEIIDDGYWMWLNNDQEEHNVGYPDTIRYIGYDTPLSNTVQFTESNSSPSYRRFHRYIESVPFGIFGTHNSYDASWAWSSSQSGQDSWSMTKYILAPFPISAYFDTLTQTTITMSNQTAWANWVSRIFDTAGLEMNSHDIQGQYVVTDNWYQRDRRANIETPYRIFWVSHMKYCSLDGVNM